MSTTIEIPEEKATALVEYLPNGQVGSAEIFDQHGHSVATFVTDTTGQEAKVVTRQKNIDMEFVRRVASRVVFGQHNTGEPHMTGTSES